LKRWGNVKKGILFLSMITMLAVLNPLSSHAISDTVGKPAPDFELEDLHTEETVKLSSFKGKPVILTFWATWCPRCWEEIEHLQAVFANNDKVVVLLVNMETQNLSSAHVKRIMKKSKEHAVKLPMLLDKRLKVWDTYQVNSLPSTVIVDPEGKVVFAEPNFYFASRDKIKKVIEKYTK